MCTFDTEKGGNGAELNVTLIVALKTEMGKWGYGMFRMVTREISSSRYALDKRGCD